MKMSRMNPKNIPMIVLNIHIKTWSGQIKMSETTSQTICQKFCYAKISPEMKSTTHQIIFLKNLRISEKKSAIKRKTSPKVMPTRVKALNVHKMIILIHDGIAKIIFIDFLKSES